MQEVTQAWDFVRDQYCEIAWSPGLWSGARTGLYPWASASLEVCSWHGGPLALGHVCVPVVALMFSQHSF